MANRAQSSTSASADASTGRSGDATVRSHSGQGRTVNNLVFLALCMAIMIGSFIAFASYPNSPLIWILGLGLYALALLIPVGILQNSTAKKAFGGRTVLMDVPSSTEVPAMGQGRTAAAFDDGPRDARERDARTAAVHHGDKYGKNVE
ncbi:hypothetical protein CK505_13845 [Kocuria sp. WN036]|uniref:hypothetical protein n=1 Tax=Kocuria sp. WN036 TaxID=2032628 RepID=UPI000BAB3D4A|nr:hypothetical protein [Kocuria sp. WN036]PAU89289.1 hypothetical protein CK505_13845 [Kocuria sp. WN036]